MQTARNLAELAEESMHRKGERHAMLFEGEFVSNGTILAEAKRLHRALAELGMQRGTVAAMCMTNHPTVYSVFSAIFRTGGTAVPVLSQLSPGELRYIFEHTEAIGIVTDCEVLDKVREAVDGLTHVRWIAVRGGASDTSRPIPEYDLAELLDYEEQPALPAIDADDVAVMLYTSGTTGRPKGVMLSHANLIASSHAVREASEYDLRPHPIIGLTSLPMAHIFGVGVMKSQYLFPEEFEPGYVVQQKWFDPERFLRAYPGTTHHRLVCGSHHVGADAGASQVRGIRPQLAGLGARRGGAAADGSRRRFYQAQRLLHQAAVWDDRELGSGHGRSHLARLPPGVGRVALQHLRVADLRRQ